MVTEKQWKVIRFIEKNLGINFKGQWKEQATVFIEKHIEESKDVAYEKAQLMREVYAADREDREFTAEDYYDYLDWYDFT